MKAKTKEIELLDVETASRLEREFTLRHVEEIKGYEVKISSDGRNYLIRLPKELFNTLTTKTCMCTLTRVTSWYCIVNFP